MHLSTNQWLGVAGVVSLIGFLFWKKSKAQTVQTPVHDHAIDTPGYKWTAKPAAKSQISKDSSDTREDTSKRDGTDTGEYVVEGGGI